MIYPTETLDYYADRFVKLRLARHGWTLQQYLAHPAAGEEAALEPEPPLACQRDIARRILSEEEGAPIAEQHERELAALPTCNNGAAIEPMHHHRLHKRGIGADFNRKRKRDRRTA